jgi:hypothetical protein
MYCVLSKSVKGLTHGGLFRSLINFALKLIKLNQNKNGVAEFNMCVPYWV